MTNGVWSTVVNTVIAMRKKVGRPIRLWVLRPIVVIVGSIATGVAVSLWSMPELWTSSIWEDEE